MNDFEWLDLVHHSTALHYSKSFTLLLRENGYAGGGVCPETWCIRIQDGRTPPLFHWEPQSPLVVGELLFKITKILNLHCIFFQPSAIAMQFLILMKIKKATAFANSILSIMFNNMHLSFLTNSSAKIHFYLSLKTVIWWFPLFSWGPLICKMRQ